MIPITAILIICIGHFLADFVFQARWMALNKSSHIGALSLHIAQYSMILLAVVWPLLICFNLYQPNGTFALWLIINAGAHFLVDFITSRITSWAHRNKHEKLFWIAIGADQLAHQACLFGTYLLLGL